LRITAAHLNLSRFEEFRVQSPEFRVLRSEAVSVFRLKSPFILHPSPSPFSFSFSKNDLPGLSGVVPPFPGLVEDEGRFLKDRTLTPPPDGLQEDQGRVFPFS